jgi:hypothetical protein
VSALLKPVTSAVSNTLKKVATSAAAAQAAAAAAGHDAAAAQAEEASIARSAVAHEQSKELALCMEDTLVGLCLVSKSPSTESAAALRAFLAALAPVREQPDWDVVSRNDLAVLLASCIGLGVLPPDSTLEQFVEQHYALLDVPAVEAASNRRQQEAVLQALWAKQKTLPAVKTLQTSVDKKKTDVAAALELMDNDPACPLGLILLYLPRLLAADAGTALPWCVRKFPLIQPHNVRASAPPPVFAEYLDLLFDVGGSAADGSDLAAATIRRQQPALLLDWAENALRLDAPARSSLFRREGVPAPGAHRLEWPRQQGLLRLARDPPQSLRGKLLALFRHHGFWPGVIAMLDMDDQADPGHEDAAQTSGARRGSRKNSTLTRMMLMMQLDEPPTDTDDAMIKAFPPRKKNKNKIKKDFKKKQKKKKQKRKKTKDK